MNDNNADVNSTSHVDDMEKITESLPVLPIPDQVAFPKITVALAVTLDSEPIIDDVMKGNRLVGLVAARESDAEVPNPDHLYQTGTVARVVFAKKDTDGTLVIIATGLQRFRVESWLSEKPYLRARVRLAPETVDKDVELEALHRNLQDNAQTVLSLLPDAPKVASEALVKIKDSLHLAYLAAANVTIDVHQRQAVLEKDSVKEKLRDLNLYLEREKEILSLSKKIRTDVREKMDKTQREFYLRQQMKAIRKELGEDDENEIDADGYRKRIETGGLSEEARKEAQRERSRLSQMSPQSAEYSMIKTYLDWLLDLPWDKVSEDQLDIAYAKTVLDEDHYGLNDVKRRIVEYLAVRNIVKTRSSGPKPPPKPGESNAMGVILCLVGPPGVGKTSLGQSIARALGREFTRMSLGGVRDEAEIRGHRRTYIGAMPGRIIQALKRAGTRNPVFMLDEIDKIGVDWRGDPSSALLEVLDPAQNATFRDHYLDVDFDLSDVIFITTANQIETIPGPLRDRMEVIWIDGYTEYEKLNIAKRFLIPRQRIGHGLRDDEIIFVDGAVQKIIRNYTRESGVRDLERQIGTFCRKCAVKIAEKDWLNLVVTEERVTEYLKREKFENELTEKIEIPGIATGLAVTPSGGDILYIEANRMTGKGQLSLTGQLGDIMKESAQIAHSFVRSKHMDLGVDPVAFTDSDVHLHVPAGAVPKDGPSAGVAMVMTLASLFSGRPVRNDVGMTGEVTLRGRVLPVGGIKMKVLAAHRAGLSKVILPKRNEKDLDDLPDEVRNDMQCILVDRIEEAIKVGLLPNEAAISIPYHDGDRELDGLEKTISEKDSRCHIEQSHESI